MTRILLLGLSAILAALTVSGCNRSSSSSPLPPIVVNSLLDLADPPPGTVTLRAALAAAASGQAVTFDPALDGGTIALSIVGDDHTVLKGEVMGIRDEPSGPVSYLVGYFDRDYGKSALYKVGDVVIDASALPAGITIAWTGDASKSRARPGRLRGPDDGERDRHRRLQRGGGHLHGQPRGPALDAGPGEAASPCGGWPGSPAAPSTTTTAWGISTAPATGGPSAAGSTRTSSRSRTR